METILFNGTPKLLWFEITKNAVVVYDKNFIMSFIITSSALLFRVVLSSRCEQ